jgi:flagellar basal body P-ring formation protein FlgA
MTSRHALLLASAFAIGSAPVTAQISPFQDPAAIDQAVSAFTGAVVGQPGGAARPVDRRLRLAACNAPLALEWQGTRQDTIVVQCPDTGGWRLFVAVSGGLRQSLAAAAAAPIAVARGEAVSITVEGEGFSVTQAGEAMDAGAQGSWIRVRTSARATPIRARIERPGLVVVPVE